MASNAEKLIKLEKRIASRQKSIKEQNEKLNADLEEYNRLYVLTLADKYKLKGKDLFSAIEREHEQLEKLREGGMTDEDIADFTAPDKNKSGNTDTENSSEKIYEDSPRTLFDEV